MKSAKRSKRTCKKSPKGRSVSKEKLKKQRRKAKPSERSCAGKLTFKQYNLEKAVDGYGKTVGVWLHAYIEPNEVLSLPKTIRNKALLLAFDLDGATQH